MSPQLTRTLIPAEQILELLNQRFSSYNVVTISTIQGDLEPQILETALELALQRYAPLRSVIINDGDNFHFAPRTNPQIALRCDSVASPDAWQSVAHTELNTPIDSAQYLVRAIWLHQSGTDTGHLITTLHHAISDGLSTIQLHHTILRDCQALLQGDSPTITQSWPAPVSATALFPPSHQGLRGKLTSLLWAMKLKRKLHRHQPQVLPFEQTVPMRERRCGFITRSLTTGQVEQLRSRCRQEQTSVQAALCASMLLSLAPLLQAKEQDNIPVVCRSFVDLRRHLNPPISREQLCFLASSLSTFHSLTAETTLWDLARETKQQLNQGLLQKDMFSAIPMARKIIEAMLERPNESQIAAGLTNVGDVQLASDYGALQLKAISFVPSQSTFGGIFAAAVTTFQGRMRLNFMFSEPSLSPATVASLADAMLLQLTQAISTAQVH